MLHLNTPQYLEIVNRGVVALVGDVVPLPSRILDVGCGSGVNGEAIRTRYGSHVVGIDSSPEAVRVARSRLNGAHVGDATRPETYPTAVLEETWDMVIFADMLEHLPDPLDALRRHIELLRPRHVLLSLPNVAIWNVRLGLLMGRFSYTETGTLDRTHLRFFTRRTIGNLIAAVGLRAERWQVTPGLLRPLAPVIKQLLARGMAGPGNSPPVEALTNSPCWRLYERWVYPAEHLIARLWPGLLAFQYVVLCSTGHNSGGHDERAPGPAQPERT